jgi:serine/threonine-protein kinase
MKTAMAIVAGDYQPLHEVRPDLDAALVATVERAMATDPAARFDSAAAMAEALAERDATVPLAGDITMVQDVSTTAVLDRSMLAGAGVVDFGSPPPVARRRSRVPLALLVGLLFVAVLVAALNRRDDGPTNQPASAQTEATQPSTTTTVAPARSQAPATTVPAVTVPQRSPATVAPAPAPAGGGKSEGKGKGDDKGKDD